MELVTPETVGLSTDRLARVSSWMERQVSSNRLAGLSAMIHRKGHTAYLNCTGQMDAEAGKPVTEDTIFRIYSMSKPITAVAAMICYEEGHFQLDDPIAKFLPEFGDMQVWDGRPGKLNTVPANGFITVRHLMTHTAGMSYEFMEATPVEAHYREQKISFNPGRQSEGNVDLATMTARLAEAPLVRHPGTGWGYSVSIDVLGRLVEVWSGQPLDRFFEERIFQPLGMTDTAFSVPPEKRDRFAACYGPSSGGDGLRSLSSQATVIRKSEGVGLKLIDAPGESLYLQTPATFSGGGGLTGTIGDYGRFCQMLLNKGELEGERLLGRKTVEFMALNHLPDNKDMAAMGQPVWSESSAEGIGYGLGMAVVIDAATTQLMRSTGEYFWGGAASTAFWIDPAEDMFAVFMTQLMPSSFYPIRSELRVAAYQAIID
ncbi:MAG: serine hydrolase domain-containing protein [Rickettsiales bacterium]|jgi:CubicO group peptidase (beta-lactamase class C family)